MCMNENKETKTLKAVKENRRDSNLNWFSQTID
jgi:hypothetical protein